MMTAHALWRWLNDTFAGHIVLFLAGTWLAQKVFRERTNSEWDALKALRWPQRAYLYWALPTSFLAATCRSIGIDGPKVRTLLFTAIFGRHAANKLSSPGGEAAAAPIASSAGPILPPPPEPTAYNAPPPGPT